MVKLVETFGARWTLSPRLHPEYPLPEARVRPDYAVETSGRIVGFLELKAPGHDVTPDGFTKRDREQWELMAVRGLSAQSGSTVIYTGPAPGCVPVRPTVRRFGICSGIFSDGNPNASPMYVSW
ncbi:hypothetical protein [Streptomyces sp. RKCA744]|uniref:hypothetical protein n=1 Tax=Streptomyces sp. RKCA744 TaxID=2959340 RepID=UPI00209EE9CF|nr:hypothetical protein [Streptomyces sp. RKCA744]MCO8307297.1 hypothetical protein [Streptomyces sp. RKCA744]